MSTMNEKTFLNWSNEHSLHEYVCVCGATELSPSAVYLITIHCHRETIILTYVGSKSGFSLPGDSMTRMGKYLLYVYTSIVCLFY